MKNLEHSPSLQVQRTENSSNIFGFESPTHITECSQSTASFCHLGDSRSGFFNAAQQTKQSNMQSYGLASPYLNKDESYNLMKEVKPSNPQLILRGMMRSQGSLPQLLIQKESLNANQQPSNSIRHHKQKSADIPRQPSRDLVSQVESKAESDKWWIIKKSQEDLHFTYKLSQKRLSFQDSGLTKSNARTQRRDNSVKPARSENLSPLRVRGVEYKEQPLARSEFIDNASNIDSNIPKLYPALHKNSLRCRTSDASPQVHFNITAADLQNYRSSQRAKLNMPPRFSRENTEPNDRNSESHSLSPIKLEPKGIFRSAEKPAVFQQQDTFLKSTVPLKPTLKFFRESRSSSELRSREPKSAGILKADAVLLSERAFPFSQIEGGIRQESADLRSTPLLHDMVKQKLIRSSTGASNIKRSLANSGNSGNLISLMEANATRGYLMKKSKTKFRNEEAILDKLFSNVADPHKRQISKRGGTS